MNDPETMKSLNRLGKWRMVFAGWQLGTRPIGEPEADALRDHREATIILRAELSALLSLLIEAKIVTPEKWNEHLQLVAEDQSGKYERFFPGFRATEQGIAMDPKIARETMAGWKS